MLILAQSQVIEYPTHMVHLIERLALDGLKSSQCEAQGKEEDEQTQARETPSSCPEASQVKKGGIEIGTDSSLPLWVATPF